MGGRSMPQECEHGRVIDWGDFGPEDGDAPPSCPECEQERTDAATRFEQVLYGEVTACAGHSKHDGNCNCQRTVSSILQRIRTDPAMVYGWLARAGTVA